MDVVLEIADTYLFDRLYANLLPIHPSVSAFDPISTTAASLKGHSNNASWNTAAGVVGEFARSGWQFAPASQYFSAQPSEYAYMSRWDRDNFWRQLVSLYALTW